MKKIFTFYQSIFLIIYLLFYVSATAQETGGPYTSDVNTILLMHFDDNLNEVASNYVVNNNGIAKTFIANPVVGLGNAIHFNNSLSTNQSFITIPFSAELSMTGNWTIEFWFCINAWDQSHNSWPVPIVLPTTGWDANYYLEIPSSTGRLKYGFSSSDGGATIFSSENSITTGTWYHVALINDYDNQRIKLILHDTDFQKLEEQSSSYTAGTTISTGTQDIKIGTGIAGDNYFNGYMDELRISNCVRDFSPILPDLPPMQAQTNNIEFYSTPEDAGNWTAITQSIQDEYTELSSFWDRPGKTPLVPAGTKIKMYLLNRADFLQYSGTQLPDWKCGWFDEETYNVIVTPPVGDEQENFYTSFEALAKGSLAQLMAKFHLVSHNNNSEPFYFMEGFGIYRGGYRPDRNMILQAINDLGRLPGKSDIENVRDFTNGYMKDLIASYIECQLFNGIVYQSISTWMGNNLWHPYFQYYHQNDDNERIMLRKETTNFNIYCTAQDNQFLDDIANRLEEKLVHYSSCYAMEIKNRFNIVIFPDEAAGMALMGYGDHYNGGSGCGGDKLDILSPVNFSGGIDEALLSLIPHEFLHVFHNHMSPDPGLINGFYTEGLAEVMAYEGQNSEYLQNRAWYFREGIERFNQENGRDPKLADIIPDTNGYMSVYSYGQAFWYYMLQNHANYVDLKEFFNASNDWDVFDSPYDEIDTGYIEFLKTLAGIPTKVNDNNSQIPIKYSLAQNFPNPFNPSTTIRFSLPASDNIQLVIYDVLGRVVKNLINGEINAGHHEIKFDAAQLSSGIYFYTLQTGSFYKSRKMLLIK